MGKDVTDVIITTRNRLSCLRRTLTYIRERTRSPYCLHVIDDASTEGNVRYLIDEWRAGRVDHLLLRGEHSGAMANLNAGTWMSFSNPVVFTDDDVLCPNVEPDWLARGLEAMAKRPRLALLALNHPGAIRRVMEVDGEVTLCKFVGGTFMFVRREFLLEHPLPHFRENFGYTPTTKRCMVAQKHGWQIGYLTGTYCQHIGIQSTLTGKQHSKRTSIEPVNAVTLEPPPRWRK